MPPHRLASACLVAAVLASCGGSSGTGPDSEAEHPLTGTFDGEFLAVADSVALLGHLTLELTEESANGALSGTFALEATLDYGEFQEPIAGGGPLVGGVSPDQIALLFFTATPDFCPTHRVDFTGTYDRRFGALLVGGPIYVLDVDCSVLFTFPSTIALSR
jgi:hypothetical protein